MTLKFTIPTNPRKKTPSLNEMIKAERTTFRSRSGKFMSKGALLKSEWQKYFSVYIRKECGRKKVTKPFVIHYHYYEPDSRRDIGNIHAPVQKYLEDALQIVGVIPNDSQKWEKGFTADFNIDKNNPRIVVEIEELEV